MQTDRWLKQVNQTPVTDKRLRSFNASDVYRKELTKKQLFESIISNIRP